MAVEDAASRDPVVSGSLGAVCALYFKTARLLENSKRYAAVHCIDPLCPLSAPRNTNVVSVVIFAER